MSPYLYLITLAVVFGTPSLIFGMKYFSAARQAQSRAAHEDAYRDLAQKVAAAQSENAATLSTMQGDLSEIKSQLAAVEKILKAVE